MRISRASSIALIGVLGLAAALFIAETRRNQERGTSAIFDETIIVDDPDPSSYAGVWILDSEHRFPERVYGEVRVIEIDDDAVSLTMIDYGGDGVSINPWTFRFNRWGPRRRPEDSRAPKTLGRCSGGRLVLTKTPGSPGGFVWVWHVNRDANELVHEVTRLSWSDDFSDRPIKGATTRFFRSEPAVDLGPGTGTASSVQSLTSLYPQAENIVVSVSPDGKQASVVCPDFDCDVIDIVGGRRSAPRRLPRGERFELRLPVALPAEQTLIEPAS